jgi:molybdopterin-containing oxidoreductase family membrane subunit
MSKLTYNEIHEDILQPLRPARPLYYAIAAILASGAGWGILAWTYQTRMGLGVTGLHVPICWSPYITNFVFWIGIGHAGTLISAILFLVRSRWRTAISRSAEAMTVFAVLTAAMFPLIHLGRLWVFYYIIPYPSQRQLWPNFISPLVWDVCAVSTYMTVSIIFWLVGLIPDAAASRDNVAELNGISNLRTRLYRIMSLGWTGSSTQWHHYGRAYLFFAALATPLVISVHSIVSWDFAMANLPGWHTTIFAPYFVAGAIHSGLAMVLVLMIPMRRLFNLQRLVTIDHFEAMAKTMIVTTLIVGYAYVLEPFIAWYSGDVFEKQFAWYRSTGWFAVYYWSLTLFNVIAPLVFLFRAARRNIKTLLIVGILVNIGMWLERFVIITGSLSHDFMPHNWTMYIPRWPEISITIGQFCLFLFMFLLFAKFLPTVAISDEKELSAGLLYAPEPAEFISKKQEVKISSKESGLLAVFKSPGPLIESIKKVRENGFNRLEAFSPFRLDEVNALLHPRKSPVRIWTLIGAISGCIGGFWLAIGSAYVNSLYTGGKFTPASYIPYCIVGFEGLILIGALSNLAGMLFHARLGQIKLPAGYDKRFTRDCFGLFIVCPQDQVSNVKTLLSSFNPEEINAVQ